MSLFGSAEFLVGANLPWVNYGGDFGANLWRPKGGVAQADEQRELDLVFARLAASGVRVVRWFLFCDGRAGIDFDARGGPQGLDGFVFRDIDKALASAQRHGLRILFVLLDFVWCDQASIVNGVQRGGRSAVLKDPEGRRRLLDRVLRPVLKHYGNDPGILAWDVINEPEWIRTLTAVQLHAFLVEAVALVHANASQPVTIGSAGTRWRSFYQGLGLDFYQVHWYDSLTGQPPLQTLVSELGFDRPTILGEFPTLGSGRTMAEILDTAHAAGYSGAFYWSALANDRCSDSASAIESARRWLA